MKVSRDLVVRVTYDLPHILTLEDAKSEVKKLEAAKQMPKPVGTTVLRKGWLRAEPDNHESQ